MSFASGPAFFLPDDPLSNSCHRKPANGRARQCAPPMEPALCEFRPGDTCIAAADGGWWVSTVLEVEDRRVYVQIRKDNTRWIEYTAPKYFPAKPPFGHRLLCTTVHLPLPAPWTGRFEIDVSSIGLRWEEVRRKPKGAEINNAALAEALQHRVEFSEKVLEPLGLVGLSALCSRL